MKKQNVTITIKAHVEVLLQRARTPRDPDAIEAEHITAFLREMRAGGLDEYGADLIEELRRDPRLHPDLFDRILREELGALAASATSQLAAPWLHQHTRRT